MASRRLEVDAMGNPIRGGRQQRKRQREESEAISLPTSSEAHSELANHLIDQWSWGLLSAIKVQLLAAKSYQDTAALLDRFNISHDEIPTTLKKLMSLGTNGRHPGNIAKQLVTWLGEPQFVATTNFPIRVKVTKARGGRMSITTLDSPFLLPHLIFAHMYRNTNNKFREKFLGPEVGREARLEHYWSEVERLGDPRLHDHPMTKIANWKTRCVPIAVHGDGVPVIRVGRAGSASLEAISMQSLFAEGPTARVKILLYSMFENNKLKDSAAGEGSMTRVWKVLAWSFKALMAGEFPRNDWRGVPFDPSTSEGMLAGTPLCSSSEKFVGVVWSVKGDLDWYSKGLGLRHCRAKVPCDFCKAHSEKNPNSRMSPLNFSARAPWKTMLRNAPEWRAEMPGKVVPLFQELPYLTMHNLECDELHILHLGVSQYALGSVLWLLTYELLPGSPTDNFDRVWQDLLVEYTKGSSTTEYTSLAISSFTDPEKPKDSFPKLKGRGAEVKSLVIPLLSVWIRYSRGTPFDTRVGSMLTCLAKVQRILDENKQMFLDASAVSELCKETDDFLSNYTKLAHESDDKDLLLFNAVPKLHFFWHMSQRARFMNPRRVATFIDEDFVKLIKQIGARCAHGTQQHNVPRSLMAKYRWGIGMQ